MGMRQNIELTFEGGEKIYLYSHWGGEEEGSGLDVVVKTALKRRQRWTDPSYLARIIFSELIRNDIDSETGFGLAPYRTGDEYPLIKVDLEKQTVNGVSFEEYIK